MAEPLGDATAAAPADTCCMELVELTECVGGFLPSRVTLTAQTRRVSGPPAAARTRSQPPTHQRHVQPKVG